MPTPAEEPSDEEVSLKDHDEEGITVVIPETIAGKPLSHYRERFRELFPERFEKQEDSRS